MRIVSYNPAYREALLEMSLHAWEPVFPRMHNDVPEFVYDAFYPQGWQQRQLNDLKEVLDQEPQNVSVALRVSARSAGSARASTPRTRWVRFT